MNDVYQLSTKLAGRIQKRLALYTRGRSYILLLVLFNTMFCVLLLLLLMNTQLAEEKRQIETDATRAVVRLVAVVTEVREQMHVTATTMAQIEATATEAVMQFEATATEALAQIATRDIEIETLSAPTLTFTPTPVPTFTSTPTPVPTFTSTPTPVPTFTSTPTPVPTFTPTHTPRSKPTNTPSSPPPTRPSLPPPPTRPSRE